MATPYKMRLGGVCCVPRALRRRNRTIAILRKAVVVTATRGMSPSPTPSATRARMLGLTLSILAEAQHLDSEALADAHQLACSDSPAIRDDVDRLSGIALEREYVPRTKGADGAQGHLAAPHLEDQLDRKLVQLHILDLGTFAAAVVVDVHDWLRRVMQSLCQNKRGAAQVACGRPAVGERHPPLSGGQRG